MASLRWELLDGVVGTISAEGVLQSPFTLSYEKGRRLYRATIDLTVEPNDVIQLDIEGDRARTIRLVGSAMPRLESVLSFRVTRPIHCVPWSDA